MQSFFQDIKHSFKKLNPFISVSVGITNKRIKCRIEN
jgi:hypothetical protein